MKIEMKISCQAIDFIHELVTRNVNISEATVNFKNLAKSMSLPPFTTQELALIWMIVNACNDVVTVEDANETALVMKIEDMACKYQSGVNGNV